MKKPICIVVTLFICIVLVSCSKKEPQSIMPYGLEWGDSYEQLVEKVGDVSELEKNPAENNVCSGSITNDYLGVDNDSLKITGNYSFQSGDTLQQIVIGISFDEIDAEDDKSFFSGLINHYDNLTGQKAEEGILFYSWETESVHIDIIHLNTGMYMVSLGQP